MTRSFYEHAASSPGKFQGEPPYTPYFYEEVCEYGPDDEFGDESSGGSYFFACNVNDADREMFPELADKDAVFFTVSEAGSVFEITEDEYRRARAEYQASIARPY